MSVYFIRHEHLMPGERDMEAHPHRVFSSLRAYMSDAETMSPTQLNQTEDGE